MSKSVSKSVRRSTSMLAIALAIYVAGPALAEGKTYHFNIPAESTAKALIDFSRQANVQIVFPAQVLEGRSSAAISGQYNRATVLKMLLDGTGLEVASESDVLITLRTASSEKVGSAENSDENTVVVVTGTHIRGGSPTSPVHTITAKEIQQSGYSQIGDVMRSLPENFSGGQNPGVMAASASNVANQNATNASTVNLRGLGSDATLVLLNGHRLPGDYGFQGSDISGVPLAAVQRIEVVPDGASALYGSDAVAGVANIIMRHDYNGMAVSARLGATTEGGGTEKTVSVLGGNSSPNGYLFGNLEYSDTGAIYARDRRFANDAAPVTTLMQPQTRKSAFLSFGRNLTDTLTASVDALISDRSTMSISQSNASFVSYSTSVRVPGYSVTAMFDQKFNNSWNAMLTAGAAGSRDSTTLLYADSKYPSLYVNHLEYLELTADGTLFQLPSGPLKLAVGAGVRDENFQSGFAGLATTLTPKRDITYAYGEALVPLISPSKDRPGLQELELNFSARTERYSDFGSSTNPKIGLRYVPFNDLTVRASWGRSFKAPSFQQSYSPYNVYLYNASLFGYSGPTSSATVIVVGGGNKNIKPEKSRSWNVGADWHPESMPTMTLSATYFDIDYTDRVIQPISPLTNALRNPLFAPFVSLSPTTAEQASVFAQATSGAFTNYSSGTYNSANVVAIAYDNYQNATAQTARGVDLSYRQLFHIDGLTLQAFANATAFKLRQQTISTQPTLTLSGTIGNQPSFKARGGVSWEKGRFSGSAIVNFLNGETDNGVTPSVHVASWTTVDATLAYRFGDGAKGSRLALTASNLFDKAPPRAASPALLYQGLHYDSTNTSIVGRFVALNITKAW